jgi:hypothetical protein
MGVSCMVGEGDASQMYYSEDGCRESLRGGPDSTTIGVVSTP